MEGKKFLILLNVEYFKKKKKKKKQEKNLQVF